MTLLPQEEKITEASNGLIVLTNKRIRMNSRSSSRQEMVSIMLPNISSISVTYKNNPLYLVLTAIILVVGIYVAGSSEDFMILVFALLLSAILVAFYFMFRRHIVQIASKGGRSIDFFISGMSNTMVHEFVHKVELAMENLSTVTKN